MRNEVSEWVQEGLLHVWRYANPSRHWRGWQFSADPAGCRSVRDLLERMHAGAPRHRTLKLEPVTDAQLNVARYGWKPAGRFEKLRIEYAPEAEVLDIAPEGNALVMTVGDKRLQALSAAFTDLAVGLDDFGIRTSDDRNAALWMFWVNASTITKKDGK